MKKLMIGVLTSTMLLVGCATTDTSNALNTATSIGTNLFSQAVDYKCRSELNQQNLYKTFVGFMTAEQKQSLENKVCGCVSQKAPQSVSASEVGQALIDPSARPQIVGKAVTNTLSACASEFLSGL